MAELTADLKEQGRSLEDQLVDLSLTYGHHVTETKRIRFESSEPEKIISKVMEDFRDTSITSINEMDVLQIKDYLGHNTETELPNSDLIVLHLENDVRVSIRPSGTEPMIKLYMEKVVTILEKGDISAENEKGKRVLKETGSWIEKFFKQLV
jgi:phosphomannomutase